MLKEFGYVDKYLKYKDFKHDRTYQAYRRSLDRFSEYVESLSSDFRYSTYDSLVEGFEENLKQNGYADSTRIFNLKVINNYFKYLNQQGASNAFGISITDYFGNKEKEVDKVDEDSIISPEEKDRLFAYVRSCDDYLNLFLFMISFYCGLRTNHLCDVPFRDLFVRLNGKLYYENKIFEKEPVSIELPTEVKEVYLNIFPEVPREYVFVNKTGKRYYARYVNRIFESYCKDAGINHYTPTDFRHSSVYYYVKTYGVDINKIMSRYNWTGDYLKRLYGDLLDLG
jgi:integrase